MEAYQGAAILLAAAAIALLGCADETTIEPPGCDGDGGPHSPQVTVTSPNGGESLAEALTITWTAIDPDPGETELLEVEIEYSPDGGDTWHSLISGEENDGSFTWNVSGLDDGSEYLVRVKVTDQGGHCSSDESDAPFAVENKIVIVDRTGKNWNITHAVRTYGMVAANWNFGLGPNAIRPIVNPNFHRPGDASYPDPANQIRILGLSISGDVRAYPVWVLSSHEVVNDVVGGHHVAVTY